MGKSLVDESDPRFLGIYAGAASDEPVRRAVEDAEVLISAGVQFTDLTSGFFSQHLDRERTIEVGPTSSSVGPAVYAPIALRAALSAVADVVTAHPRPRADPESEGAPELARPADDSTLDQETVWDLVNGVLSPGNIVLADQGTAFYGMATHRLPHGVTFIGQPLWASIGYTLPAALGAGLAHPDRRPVVLIGDGAAQLTVQAIGTILRVGLTPVVIVVNNDGYGVERAIHGPTREYNDIGLWNWTLLPQLFSGPAGEAAFVARASTVGELRSALDGAGQAQDRLALVELVLPRLDIPPLLATLAKAAGAANART